MSKVILITGSGSGIGRETALYLSKKGYRMVLTDYDLPKIVALKDEITKLGGDAVTIELDVKRKTHFEEALDFAVKNYGTLDIWINNAGIMPSGNFLEMSENQDQDLMDINLHGTARGLRTALSFFKNKGHGHVINIASVTARVPLPYAAMYSASKSAIITLCDALRIELANPKISISCILPGTVDTPLIAQMKPTLFPPVITPQKVAKAVAEIIIKPKNSKFLPWYLGPMSWGQYLLPTSLVIKLGNVLKITDSLKPENS